MIRSLNTKGSMTVVRRRLIAVLAMLALAVGALLLIYWLGPHSDFLPKCLFHAWTGLHCPGCGMTRAVDASLHGRFLEAFRFNPVVMVLLPLTMIGIGLELIGWVRDRPLSIRFRVGRRLGWSLLALLLLFWVLRNIPIWPLTLLAP